MLSREEAQSIIEAGILAPSADNRHMLRFQVVGDTVRLLADARFETAPFHKRILALISLGAVVENMVLRSASLGLHAEEMWPGADPSGKPIVLLRFSPTQARASELGAAIAERHTNRRLLFRGPALSGGQQRQVEQDVESVGGVQLLWLDAPELRRQALRLVTMAEAERFRSRPLHADLFSGIRFDVGWRASSTEGLPPGALEIELPMRPLFTMLRHWSVMRPLTVFGVPQFISLRGAYGPCWMAPHLCVLATSLGLERGPIAVGRALERVWLRAACLGLAFQPFAASALLALDGYREVDERIRRGLVDGWRRICPDALPLMVFRMGHARPVSLRTGRPAVRELLAPPGGA
jgi:hypothetical protein